MLARSQSGWSLHLSGLSLTDCDRAEMAYAMGEIEELLGLALTVRAESRLQRQQTARLRSESSSPPPNLSHESRLSLSPIGSQPDGHLCAIQRRLDETLAALDAAQTAYDQAQSELADTRRLLNATELALVQAQQQAAVAASPASAKQPPGNCIDGNAGGSCLQKVCNPCAVAAAFAQKFPRLLVLRPPDR